MNVVDFMTDLESRAGTRPIIHFRDREVTVGAFRTLVAEAAAQLDAAGVGMRDRVALLSYNRPEWLAIYCACLARGATLVPLNPALSASEVAFILEDCTPALVVVDDRNQSRVPQEMTCPIEVLDDPGNQSWHGVDTSQWPTVVDLDPTHPALIHYTSGTTGHPKGAVLPHRGVAATLSRTTTWVGSTSDDSILINGSLAFIMHSTIAAMGHIAIGATVVLQERFHPAEAARAIDRYGATVIMWVPTMYVMLCEFIESHPQEEVGSLDSLRVCVSSAASLPWSLVERMRAATGKTLHNAWGMTEGTPLTGFPPGSTPVPDSVGPPIGDSEIRILDASGSDVEVGDVGEIVFRSPSNMTEYYNRPEATKDTIIDGWVHSGDLGHRDAAGNIYISGRIKDMIIRGGANIYPAEIESVLAEHDTVAEAAVIGIPDERFGEIPVAYVVARGGEEPDNDVLRDFCATRLASYKVPAWIAVVDDLPRGPTGKTLKRVLRHQTEAAQSATPTT
ncbi:AMP-binding protein [Nocardioides sp. QY071]|uniref:class I adenylate-forming enzyme family protein n=1 Tax=Nocardioides sp. QY071 TaxID=3044187 RepID=UPI00249B850F|nr:AMP-binding protein [Nocardioides sp. QY071]WGY00457.1 AMP-binding protein [Nocardioides sp. QY071]